MENKFDISDFVNIKTIQKTKEEIVNRFIKRRKELKLSQKEISKIAGVSYGSLRRFEECGEISFSSLLKIAEKIDSLEDFNQIFSKTKIKDLKDYKI